MKIYYFRAANASAILGRWRKGGFRARQSRNSPFDMRRDLCLTHRDIRARAPAAANIEPRIRRRGRAKFGKGWEFHGEIYTLALRFSLGGAFAGAGGGLPKRRAGADGRPRRRT